MGCTGVPWYLMMILGKWPYIRYLWDVLGYPGTWWWLWENYHILGIYGLYWCTLVSESLFLLRSHRKLWPSQFLSQALSQYKDGATGVGLQNLFNGIEWHVICRERDKSIIKFQPILEQRANYLPLTCYDENFFKVTIKCFSMKCCFEKHHQMARQLKKCRNLFNGFKCLAMCSLGDGASIVIRSIIIFEDKQNCPFSL